MKLAHFIQTNMERLLEEWEGAVLEIAPELKGKDSIALRDHAREMLGFIIEDISTSHTIGESARKALGKGKALVSDVGKDHGQDRHRLGMSVHQLVQELRSLRARVTKAWGYEQRGLTGKDIDELVRFNEAIDQLVATSMSSFSALNDQVLRLIETMLKASPNPAAIYEPDGKHLFINEAMSDLANATHRDFIGKTPCELGLDIASELNDAITIAVTTGETQRRELYHCSQSGRVLYLEYQFVPVFNDQNEIEAVINMSRDTTERKQAEYQAWRGANYDTLTGIPNRRLFLDRLEQTLLEAERKGSSFALLFIDLDLFKQANDQLGHKAGDRLLAKVAERINTKVRAMDSVARLGGDEFTVILKETSRNGANEAAKALLTNLEQMFNIDSQQIHISASIGLTLFPEDGNNANQLIDNADQAMYAAKKQGGHQVQVYESSIAHSRLDHIRMSLELDNALKQNQLEVYYQPIIDIRTGAICRAEALLRWNHPDKGLMTPTTFLGVTEQSGLTDKVSSYVLNQAVICQHRWFDLEGKVYPININESPASFVTRNLVDQWQARLTQIGLEKSWITIELTPASFNNIYAAGFNSVKSLGLPDSRLKLAINDFGIEPLSLLALQEFKLDSVKIGRELIKDAGKGGDADRILGSIIAMAHAIDVQVVGVGVETDQQLQFLARVGCDYAQGFLISRPLAQDDFEALLKQHHDSLR